MHSIYQTQFEYLCFCYRGEQVEDGYKSCLHGSPTPPSDQHAATNLIFIQPFLPPQPPISVIRTFRKLRISSPTPQNRCHQSHACIGCFPDVKRIKIIPYLGKGAGKKTHFLWSFTIPPSDPPGYGLFTDMKIYLHFFFWNKTTNSWNKFYIWSHSKI